MFKFLLVALLCLLAPAIAAEPGSESNFIWITPGIDAADSMPLGNGSLGINLWVEGGGDLLFYLSSNDS